MYTEYGKTHEKGHRSNVSGCVRLGMWWLTSGWSSWQQTLKYK